MKCRKGKKCKPVAEAPSSKKKGQAGWQADKGSKPAKAAKSGHGKKKKPAN
jgi:hypothetical protein